MRTITIDECVNHGITSAMIRNAADYQLGLRNQHLSAKEDIYTIKTAYGPRWAKEYVTREYSHKEEAEKHEEAFRSLVSVAKELYARGF